MPCVSSLYATSTLKTAAWAAVLQGKFTGAFSLLKEFLLINPNNQRGLMVWIRTSKDAPLLALGQECKVFSSLRPSANCHPAPTLKHHSRGSSFWWLPSFPFSPYNAASSPTLCPPPCSAWKGTCLYSRSAPLYKVIIKIRILSNITGV